MKKMTLAFALLGLLNISCGQTKKDKVVGGACDKCNQMFEEMPSDLPWNTTIAGPDEPGERLVIHGTIFKKDGKTPAPDVILYVYHTDNKGLYSPSLNQTSGKEHGHLRGWIKTDRQGHYEFKSIRPASYPNRRAPQHIHSIIKEEGLTLYWIDEYLFEDDPLLTTEERGKQEKRGGSGIIRLEKKNGVWVGKRDIILGMNIPGY